MIYTCEDCEFLFRRASKVSECPSCDKAHIRHATNEEKEQIMQQLDQPQKQKV